MSDILKHALKLTSLFMTDVRSKGILDTVKNHGTVLILHYTEPVMVIMDVDVYEELMAELKSKKGKVKK